MLTRAGVSFVIATLLGVLGLVACVSPTTDRRPPNFVIILADDLGYGDIGPYDGWIDTPALQRMADEGLRFTDFHTSGTVCSPTRAGLMTGQYQERVGVPGVINADPALEVHHTGLDHDAVTLAEALGATGYRTALFGKWHLGYVDEHHPHRHGFDVFRGFKSGNIDYHSHRDRMNTEDWWIGDERRDEPGYLTDLITEHAVHFVHEQGHEPFLLYVAHGAPHSPLQSRESPAHRGPTGRKSEETATRDQIVTGMVTALDDSVSAILDALSEAGLARDTLVLFLSDNGGAGHMRNDPLRGQKAQVWEGGHRVPALCWWPGRIAAGEVSSEFVTSLDVMPTMLALAGTTVNASRFDGRDVHELLLNGTPPDPMPFVWEGKALRDGRWKLVEKAPGLGSSPALFDLQTDLSERNDVAAKHPDRVDQMQKTLAAWRDKLGPSR